MNQEQAGSEEDINSANQKRPVLSLLATAPATMVFVKEEGVVADEVVGSGIYLNLPAKKEQEVLGELERIRALSMKFHSRDC